MKREDAERLEFLLRRQQQSHLAPRNKGGKGGKGGAGQGGAKGAREEDEDDAFYDEVMLLRNLAQHGASSDPSTRIDLARDVEIFNALKDNLGWRYFYSTGLHGTIYTKHPTMSQTTLKVSPFYISIYVIASSISIPLLPSLFL